MPETGFPIVVRVRPRRSDVIKSLTARSRENLHRQTHHSTRTLTQRTKSTDDDTEQATTVRTDTLGPR